MNCIVAQTTGGVQYKISQEDKNLIDLNWTIQNVKNLYPYVTRRARPGRTSPKVFMHRIVLGRMFPQLINDRGLVGDHINGDTLDNRRENLRLITKSQNRQNSGADRETSSGYRGVHWNETQKKWVARIRANKEDHFLGYFGDRVEAAKAYNAKATELYGEFARLNKV